MIRIDFKPDEIPGSLLLGAGDLKDASALATRLREAADPVSEYLRGALSPAAQTQLGGYDGSVPPPEPLRDALVDELNRQLGGPLLYARQRFKGVELARDTLIKALIKQNPLGEGLLRLNRLLLEDAYPDEIARSPRAEWDAWGSLAQDATERVIAEWEDYKPTPEEWQKTETGPPPEFDPTWEEYIWKGINNWLLKYVFHNKCAYCETRTVGYIADAEHFRPKGRVRTKSGIVKTFDVDGKNKITHPGYFWLAYHWKNLLPSCNTCNRYGGKKDLFPVGNDHIAVRRITDPDEKRKHEIRWSKKVADICYLEPEALDAIEDRLLLHPYFDDPEKDVYFQLDGKAVARTGSKRGKASIEVFNLNEANKIAERSRVQNDATKLYLSKITPVIPDMNKMRSVAREVKDEYFKGGLPYGAATFDYLRTFFGDSVLNPEVLLNEPG
ncbi:MAG TPA: hypothetical protein VGB98_14295 [Pyrinomonadaceae bacterium]